MLRHSEARLQTESARLQAVVQSMSDAVYIGDASGITLANKAAIDQTGYSSAQELNRSIGLLAKELDTRDAETNRLIPAEELSFLRALRGEYIIHNVQVQNLTNGTKRILWLRHSLFDNPNNNRNLYNGKELQEELTQYDYCARFYDPFKAR